MTDDTLCRVSLSGCSCIYHLTEGFTGDPNATEGGKLDVYHFIGTAGFCKEIRINQYQHSTSLETVSNPGHQVAKVIMDTAHHVCCYGLRSTYNTHSIIDFCISTVQCKYVMVQFVTEFSSIPSFHNAICQQCIIELRVASNV